MTRDDQPQNIYDRQEFFAGYSQMERFQHGWGWALEHRPFLRMLGDVSGKRVLDLGCGGGQLAYYLAEAGAVAVTASDVSERMLAVARSQYAHPNVAYVQQAIEDADFAAGSFDCVVSSLAFHYVADYRQLVGRISRWLVGAGVLVFSTEHPIYAARSTDEGWVTAADGSAAGWAIDDYADEGLRERYWFVPGVRRYHRTLATLLNELIDAGFSLNRVEETWPDEAWLKARPQDADERRRPMFLLVSATRA